MSLPLWCHKHLAQGTAWHDFAHPKAPMDFWRLEAQVSLQLYKEGYSTGSEAYAKALGWHLWTKAQGNQEQGHEAWLFLQNANTMIPYKDLGDLHDELDKVRQKLPPQALPEYRA